MDITTYCDIYTCEDCPRYGDDCDGDKRVEHTDLISRADAIKAVASITMSIHLSDVICDKLFALPSAEAGWIPCSERLPDACNEVLLTCEVRPINHKPSKYVCTAQWIPKFCKEALSVNWDEEATEYCEEDDEFYPHEGWYESISNWGDYSLVGISDFAIAWMPLPKPYREDGEAE